MTWTRRQIIITSLLAAVVILLGSGAFVALILYRFLMPRPDLEFGTIIGKLSDYGLGVDTRFQEQYRIWVVRNTERLFVIYARCTHLGCTPEWKANENKFKCPCHGSAYNNEGINIEGPTQRPMDRAHVELSRSGQVVVDIRRLYSWEKERNEFDDPGSHIKVEHMNKTHVVNSLQ